jgi:Coenzyme PQQ synthesis protein D (PqqD)
MAGEARYVLNNPPVVAELIEGEIIALNLENGTYYSLRGPSADVWGLLLDGYSVGEIAAGFAAASSNGLAGEPVGRFVASLVSEGLIVAGAPDRPVPSREIAARPWPSDGLSFERFADMEESLRIDPIHEIDDAVGWPKPSG